VLGENQLRPIARDAFRGLYYLNKSGYPHRDIKGDNILLSLQPDGTYMAKLADFGMSKPADEGLHTFLGTPEYMAPEVIQADKGYDLRCDVWSMGITFYKCLTGFFPFPRSEVKVQVCKPEPKMIQLKENIEGVKDERLKFSECCRHFIQSLLTKNFEDRLFANQALRHPFLMPVINVVQFVQPDDLLKVCVARIQAVENGKKAFECARSRDNCIMTHYPPNTLDWSLTWGDFARAIKLEKTDVVVLAKGCRVFENRDRIDYTNEHINNVVIFPRRKSVTNIDRSILVKSIKDGMAELKKGRSNAIETLNLYLKYLNTIHLFCHATQRVSAFVTPLISFESTWKHARLLQNEVLKCCSDFPTVVFFKPPPRNWRSTMTENDMKEVVALQRVVEECNQSAKEKTNASYQADLSEEMDKLRKMAAKWMGNDLHPCIEHAIETFNNYLDTVRADVDVLNRMLDFIALLNSIHDNSGKVYPKLVELVNACPYLQFSKKGRSSLQEKGILHESTETEETIRELTKQREELKKMVERNKKSIQEVEAGMQESQRVAKEAIDSLENVRKMLQEALEQKGLFKGLF